MKQMRHWSLILMLSFPSRSPDSFSNLFAGGILKSFRVFELLIMRSFVNYCSRPHYLQSIRILSILGPITKMHHKNA